MTQRIILFCFLLKNLTVFSQNVENDTLTKEFLARQVVVIAQKDRLLSGVPGAASYIEPLKMKRIAPLTGNEVFRKLPGVHVVEEEGMGLRMNLSIRGLDPDRSANVLILEDGIPVQLNPYGEPEMYYTPAIDRMSAVEVLKGSGQILFGPRTVGGVVNYITADAPNTSETRLTLKGGSGGFLSGHIQHGNRSGNVAWLGNYLFKRADKIGTVGFEVHDFNAKVNFQASDKSSLALKLQLYQENSNATYIGITQPMYEAGQFYPILAPDDHLEVQRAAVALIHKYFISKQLKLQTNAYAYTISRNWRRQSFASSAAASQQTGVIWGDPTIVGGAIFMQKNTGLRNRSFGVGGFETKLTYDFQLLNFKNQLEVGGRLLAETAQEQELLGRTPTSTSGNLVTDERRPGAAASVFAQNKFILNEKWSITAGIRHENYHFERQIALVRTSTGAVLDTFISAKNHVAAVIPGVGFNFLAEKWLNIFGGVHRGFAPPAIKNSVSAVGQVFELEPQLSWNYELGARASFAQGIDVELTGFYLDFQKQVIPISESAGGSGAGFANAGRTKHIGLEASFRCDFGKVLESDHSIFWEANATFSEATFDSDRLVGNEKVNIRGNYLPYAPRFFNTQTLGWVSPKGFELQLTGNYTASQFSDVLNTEPPTANGRTGKIPAFFVVDITVRQSVKKWNAMFFASVKNLTDERYVASRRPTGIRVGIPRTILAGVECRF